MAIRTRSEIARERAEALPPLPKNKVAINTVQGKGSVNPGKMTGAPVSAGPAMPKTGGLLRAIQGVGAEEGQRSRASAQMEDRIKQQQALKEYGGRK